MHSFLYDDILILGDSFAANRDQPNTWIRYFTETLTGSTMPARGRGYVGASWWSVRQKLIKELDRRVPKILILCHTEPMRLPNEHNLPISALSVEEPNVHMPYGKEHLKSLWHDVCDSAKLYYKNLFLQDFHIWTQMQWFKELDEILEQYDIPYVIHIHCFKSWPPYKETYTFKHGFTVEEILFDYAGPHDVGGYLNHFTDETNIRLGTKLIDVINNYTTGKHKIGL